MKLLVGEMPTQLLVCPMVEATRPGLLTSVASPLTYAGWDCGRGSASSSVTQLAWRSSSFSMKMVLLSGAPG